MVTMNTLKSKPGTRKQRKRVGRGQGSGSGCTAGYGMNGAKARSGNTTKAYFEGGQTPLTRRLPKKGFKSPFKVVYQIVNVGDLCKIDASVKEVDATVLFESGLIHSKDRPVKVLGNGEIDRAVVVKVDAYSKAARDKLGIPKTVR